MEVLTELDGWLKAAPLAAMAAMAAVATVVALVALVTLLAARGWLRRRRPAPVPPPGAPPAPAAGSLAQRTVSSVASAPAPALKPGAASPAVDLPDFRPVRVQALSPPQQRHLLHTHVALPRPSRLLDQLLSPTFINEASARQLADLVAGEPLLAARVLKAVNSPFYGLPQPVNSIAQAVSYLGLTTVRITCLRYIFIAAFNTGELERQQAIDRLWLTSARASELMQRATSDLHLHDAPRWSSAVLLSFLGRLAVLASAPLQHLPALCDVSPVRRAQAEQAQTGLCAAELGRLLMTDWGLPATVVNDAADIEWLLFEAPPWPADGRGEALALCGLCVRLSERRMKPLNEPLNDPLSERLSERLGERRSGHRSEEMPLPPSDHASGLSDRAGGALLEFETDATHEIACLRARMGAALRTQIQLWLGTPAVQQG